MLTGSTIFTGLVDSADVGSLLVQYGYVIAGLIAVLLVLAPFFIAKGGFNFIIRKVSSLFGG